VKVRIMQSRVGPAQAELLGVLADVLRKDELDTCSWLGPEAWLPCPYEVAGGLWLEGDALNDGLDEGLGSRVARELERRTQGPAPVVSAKRVLPGEGTLLVWYRHLN
jgi:hypothetical protein